MIPSQLEQTFIQFAEEPGTAFRTEYGSGGLIGLCVVIAKFSAIKCYGAVRILRDLCFESKSRFIKEAPPFVVREFIKLIGKDVFRSELERSIGKNGAATFILQLTDQGALAEPVDVLESQAKDGSKGANIEVSATRNIPRTKQVEQEYIVVDEKIKHAATAAAVAIDTIPWSHLKELGLEKVTAEFPSPEVCKRWLNRFDLVSCVSIHFVRARIRSYLAILHSCEQSRHSYKGSLSWLSRNTPQGPEGAETMSVIRTVAAFSDSIKKCRDAIEDLRSASTHLPDSFREVHVYVQKVERLISQMNNYQTLFNWKTAKKNDTSTVAPPPSDAVPSCHGNSASVRLEMLFGSPWREYCQSISRVIRPLNKFQVDTVAQEILPIQIDVLDSNASSMTRLEASCHAPGSRPHEGIELQAKLESAVDRFLQFLQLVKLGGNAAM
jgi:hypothetical protein